MSGFPTTRGEVVGKPFVLHWRNGYGYWVAPASDSRRAVTNCYGRPEPALDEFGLFVASIIDHEKEAMSDNLHSK